MGRKTDPKRLVEERGTPYSEELGIDLRAGKAEEISKWFLASILFGARISEGIAKKTYKEFERRNVTTARKILDAGWNGLVEILDTGGYVRYDFRTADKLLEVFGSLQKLYDGDLNKLHERARDSRDLEEKIKALGKGIGDTTVAIFLRDMRYCWSKADPRPTQLIEMGMRKYNIRDLKKFAAQHGLDLVKLETAMLRLGKALRRSRQ